MTRRSPRYDAPFVVVLLVLLVAAGCGSGGSDGTASTVTKPAGKPLEGTHWLLSGATNSACPPSGCP
jgi:hypothetical protein